MKIAFIVPDNRDHLKQPHLPGPTFGPAPQSLLDGFAQLPGECEIHILSLFHRPLPSPEKLAPNLFFHHAVVPSWGWGRSLYLGCSSAINRLLRKIQPDIVHGQGSETYPAISAARSGWPNVVTLHGNMRAIAEVFRARPFSYLWVIARVEAMALRKTDGVVCISSYTRSLVEALARKTWLLPNAADDPFFDVPRNPAQPPEILCIGYTDARKNQIGLIKALDPLAAQHKFVLRFLGKVSDDDYGREFRELLKTRPWCQAPGFTDRAALRAAFARASLLALPSVEENCPMVVLEAMAAGLPVGAAKVGGVPDLVENQKTGLFFDPADAESIRRAIEPFLTSPSLGETMGQAGRAVAQARFRPKEIARRHLEIYREIVASRRPA